MSSILESFADALRQAMEKSQPLYIRGGGSKYFYGNPLAEKTIPLDVAGYQGIVDYEPSELAITARAGTSLQELENILAQQGQMLAFEPPHFGKPATLGGSIASGLSGPRRAYAGAVRDFILGVRLLDGQGREMSFGGRVMKNVAGYDVSRLMAGSMGTLGILLEASLKVLPRPEMERTLCFATTMERALEWMRSYATRPLPVSATCFSDGRLYVRLSGMEAAVVAAQKQMGGDVEENGETFWESIRHHTHTFFHGRPILWRLSVKPTTAHLPLPGEQLIEWGGALRWFAPAEAVAANEVRRLATAAGGHATLFYGDRDGILVFQPLSPVLLRIHQRLKQQFDPAGILNPYRMYPEF
ncbi:MAG TPA: glycolate oxidase subunit GlcE [Nitrosomonas mobilis]|nr:glycolate oxidase subunit GlcE [Nitrosomonas mobilis]